MDMPSSHQCWGTVLLLLAFFILILETPSTQGLYTQRGDHGSLQQTVHWFTQKLDHFNNEETRTFEQRYFVDAHHFRDPRSSPVILYICGESRCGGVPENYLQTFASKLGALIVAVEHRYYGESTPFSELSTDNLRFLSSRQALADLASFRVWFHNNVLGGTKNPWISVGGSYPGALSAWFRLKYPDMVAGALSSSGVINAIYDFDAFDVQVAQSAGPRCAEALRAVTTAVEHILLSPNATENERREAMAAFGAPRTGPGLAVGEFFYFLADTMAESIQYGFHSDLCDPTVVAYEQGLRGQQLMLAYADVVNTFWKPTFDPDAPLSYGVIALQNTTSDSFKSGRQWWWQKCSELAYFQTAPSTGSIRSSVVNLPFHLSFCRQVFGQSIVPDTEATNAYYGALDIQNTASNIYFANGSQDPWQQASLVHTSSEANPSIETGYATCDNCGHCVDLRGCPSLPGNPPLANCTDQIATDVIRSRIITNMLRWASEHH